LTSTRAAGSTRSPPGSSRRLQSHTARSGERQEREHGIKASSADKKQFGPWAVVTGASSGIGREFARHIAASGINVIVVARRLHLLEELGAQLERDFGVEHKVVQADLSEDGFLEKVTDVTRDLDVGLVVSNAGTAVPGYFLRGDPRDLLKLFKLNAQAHLEISHFFGRKLAQRGRGGLLLTGAMGATQGVPFVSAVSASKAFVQTLGESLNFELSPLGINVTVLVVGPTQTAIIDKFGLDPATMPMKPMPVEQCVYEGLEGLKRNFPSLINGRTNRTMNTLIPVKLQRGMMKEMMEKGLSAQGKLLATVK
jgi:short-subunit dehydrogenase